MDKAAVTAVCWVPRGRCRPRHGGGGEAEMRQAREEEGGGDSGAAAAASSNTDGLEEFNLDRYDEDDDEGGMQFFSVLNADGELAKERDPYMQGNPDTDSESEDFEIGADDKVFAAVTCEEDVCNLELYIYDEEEQSTYVHHDLMLGAYPLCIEWLSSGAAGEDGNFAAIGLIDHSIQLWDLDDLDALEPTHILGPKKKAKAKKKKGLPAASGPKAHDGPVLCLHGSSFNRNVLVSGSADETVKVWDVASNSCVHTYSHHTSKVQCARWHPTEQAVLLSAAFDRNLALLDVRQPNQAAMAPLPAEAECTIWSRHRPFECLASVDSGFVACYDVRKVVAKSGKDSILWTMQAHDVACTSVQDMPAPSCVVTTGLEGSAKVWEVAAAAPRMVMEKNLHAGPIFACQSCPEAPGMLCFGGRCPVLWDLTSEQLLMDAFKFEEPKVAEA